MMVFGIRFIRRAIFSRSQSCIILTAVYLCLLGASNADSLEGGDDHGDTCENATVIHRHTSIAGVLNAAGDVDVFHLTLPVDGTLRAMTTGRTDTVGTLRTSAGFLVAIDDDRGADRNFALSQGLTAGTYCLEVRGFTSSAMGMYTLAIHFDDHGETCETATRLPGSRNVAVSGALDVKDDLDVFRISLDQDTLLTATTVGESTIVVTIRDLLSNVVAEGLPGFGLSRFVSAGDYCIELKGVGRNTTGLYVLVLDRAFELQQRDHGGTCKTATSVRPIPASATPGVISQGESDMFRITLPLAGRLTLTTTGDTDTVAILRDEAGNMIVEDDDRGFGHNFGLSVPLTAGSYCLEVTGRDLFTNGDYILVARLERDVGLPVDDHGDACSAATFVALPAAIPGALGSVFDSDSFRITVPTEGVLTLTTKGAADTFATLRDENGMILAEDEDSGTRNNFGMSLPIAAGEYCVEIDNRSASFERSDVFVGSYVLHAGFVNGSLEDDHGETCATSTPIPPISATPGRLSSAGDIDAFRVTLVEPGRLIVTTVGEEITKGRLRDGDGQVVAEIEGRASAPNFVIPLFLPAGAYCIEVMGQNAFATGRYMLVSSFASDVRDDHADSCAMATQVPLISITPSVLETLDDRDAFRVSLPTSGRLTVGTLGDTNTSGTLRDVRGEELGFDNGRDLFGGFGLSMSLEAGEYCIEVHGDDLDTIGRYGFVSSFESGMVDDPGATCETATPVDPLSSTAAALEREGDVDVFRVTLDEAGRLTTLTIGDLSTDGTLRDLAGTVLALDMSSDALSFSRLLGAGDYCIEVRGRFPDELGDYTFVSGFEPGPRDDHGDTCDQATRLDPTASLPGGIQTMGDMDVFRVTLPVAGRLTALTTGTTDTIGTLRDVRNGILATNIGGAFGGNFSIVSFFLNPGDYCIEVRGDDVMTAGGYTFITRFEAE